MSRHRLQVQLGRSIAIVALVVQALVVLVLGLLTSRQLHQRTDVLLLHLAHSEAHDMLEHGTGFHVHDLALQLPGLFGRLSNRYALVYDGAGQVLDRTDNLSSLASPQGLPFIGPDAKAIFIDHHLDEIPMRFVIMPARLEQHQVSIAVGVAHRDLESVLWNFVATAAGLGLLSALAIALAGAYFVRRSTADLNELSAACGRMELSSHRQSAQRAQLAFEVPAGACEEVHLLARTLRELMARVHDVLETQNFFVAEAAHELRTPLTSLRGDLELALRRERTLAEYRDFITEAQADVDRLQRLALQLLEGARGREGLLVLEAIDLKAFLAETLKDQPKHLDPSLELQLDLKGPVQVLAEETALRRVLLILVDNWRCHAGPSRLSLSAQVQAIGEVLLRVADDGKGIGSELRARLFRPFQRGSQKGFGLGLYIAAQLMQALQGEIELEEQAERKGCCFILHLRAAPPEQT